MREYVSSEWSKSSSFFLDINIDWNIDDREIAVIKLLVHCKCKCHCKCNCRGVEYI